MGGGVPLLVNFEQRFPVGCLVRYKPGVGTYGYEESLDAEGRVLAKVTGHSKTRVKLELRLTLGGRPSTKATACDPRNLERVVDIVAGAHA